MQITLKRFLHKRYTVRTRIHCTISYKDRCLPGVPYIQKGDSDGYATGTPFASVTRTGGTESSEHRAETLSCIRKSGPDKSYRSKFPSPSYASPTMRNV